MLSSFCSLLFEPWTKTFECVRMEVDIVHIRSDMQHLTMAEASTIC